MKALLAEGLAESGLAADQAALDGLAAYLEILRDGNRRANLVGADDPAELAGRHLLDSAVFLPPLRAAGARRVVDVGSGGGLPGVVLALLEPGLEVTLIESRAKKAAFLEDAVRRLGLPSVRVESERAEALGRDPAHRESYDAGVARALAELAIAVELVLPFVRPGGLALFAKGPRPWDEIAAAAEAVRELGGAPRSATAYGPVPFHLVRIDKVARTPEAYPRRPGVPQKRPLRRGDV